MMHGDDSKHDELDHERSRLVHENAKEIPDIPMCGCLSVRYYQPYFDIDTSDVGNRIAQSVFYCRREQNFLALIEGRPDGYGPFWVRRPFERLRLNDRLDAFHPQFHMICHHLMF